MTPLIFFHTALSLFAIAAGVAFTYRLLAGKFTGTWTTLYLATTLGTSYSGFVIPVTKILPSHVFAVLSIVVLAVSVRALYTKHLQGVWKNTFIATTLFAFYLNVFVLVVQSFMKVPALKVLAPTQTEPAFALAQSVVLLSFLGIGYLAFKRARSVHVAA